jgi:hypothetical protein
MRRLGTFIVRVPTKAREIDKDEGEGNVKEEGEGSGQHANRSRGHESKAPDQDGD